MYRLVYIRKESSGEWWTVNADTDNRLDPYSTKRQARKAALALMDAYHAATLKG